MELIHDNGTTGNFEVVANNVLVHSKKVKGHGFLDSQPKLDALIAGILATTEKKEEEAK